MTPFLERVIAQRREEQMRFPAAELRDVPPVPRKGRRWKWKKPKVPKPTSEVIRAKNRVYRAARRALLKAAANPPGQV